MEFTAQVLHLFEQIGRFLRWVSAHLQQRQHQRGEFMAQRHAGKTHARVHARVGDQERRLARIGQVVLLDHGNLVGKRFDLIQKLAHLLGGGAVVQCGHQLHRALQALQIRFQLGLKSGVKHGFTSDESCFGIKKARAPGGPRASSTNQLDMLSENLLRSYRPGRAREPESWRLLPTWRGTLRRGAKPRIEQP
ncbi:hypothetical protein SDC9_101177 [bioreactor metagenome]|uniref:Uncharacterized protein n=1 Tax=bioreactor metagenome TaxID=1076179 RepID=A0A645AMM2_9ZZZZ